MDALICYRPAKEKSILLGRLLSEACFPDRKVNPGRDFGEIASKIEFRGNPSLNLV